jgi:hypothetical protein
VIQELNDTPSDALGGLKPSAFQTIWDSKKLDKTLPRASREPNYHIQLRNQKKYLADKSKLQRGDYVLLDNSKNAFDKITDWQRSPQVYVVSEVRACIHPPLFLLRNLDNTPIFGYYYRPQLKLTTRPKPGSFFHVEKSLDKRQGKKEIEHLVKFIGYDNSYNKWLPESYFIEGPDTKQ